MSMSTGQKIALGCGCVVLLAGAAIVAFVGVGTYWAKGKLKEAGGRLEKFTAKTEEIEKWEKQANANPFTPPADGVIQEAQLRKFLDVRKDVYAVYEEHKPQFDALGERTKDKKTLSLSETIEAGSQIASLVGDIRLTQAKALAAAGMSENEYRYIQMAVYKSAWAASAEKELGGRQPSEVFAEAMKQAGGAVREGAEAAKREGIAGTQGTSEADIRKAEEEMAKAGQEMKALDVPKANVELFRKYKEEIDKYAMHGLAFVGL